MEFSFITSKVLSSDGAGLAILSSSQRPAVNLNQLRSNGAKQATLTSLNIYDSSNGHPVDQIIDRMGMASSKAQMLATTITTAAKFFSSSDQKLYFKTQGNSVIGFLKTGRRTLF